MKRLLSISAAMAAVMALATITGCVFDPSGIKGECGNGILEPGEQCDGADLGGATCRSLGYDGGQLACSPSCTFDTSACTEGGTQVPTCGDGWLDPGEQCDGTDLGGATCESLGYDGGQLACSPSCTYDARGCIGGQPTCGNGILEAGEECDDGTANSDTEPDACRTDCTFAHCGDGVVDSSEQCDGTNLGGATCESLGYDAGTLGCTDQCRFDTTDCTGNPTAECGNGVWEPGEECDWGENNSDTEPDACRTDCTFAHCGDGVVDSGEECDGTVPQDATTCEDLGFHSGTVVCSSDCTLDYSGCGGWCGDGIKNGTEQCDGTDFGGATCADYGAFHPAQALRCNADCTVDISECPYCGDGNLDSQWEECDGTVPPSADTCADRGYYGGDVACLSSCRLDYSDCEAHGWCGDGTVQPTYEVCDSTGIIELGDFHGTCSPDCQELVLTDQLEDSGQNLYESIRGGGFMNIVGILPQDAYLLAVAGMADGTVGGFSPRDGDKRAGFVLTYGLNFMRRNLTYITDRRGSTYYRVDIWWGDTTADGTVVVSGKSAALSGQALARSYPRSLVSADFAYYDGLNSTLESSPRIAMAGGQIYLLERYKDTDGYVYKYERLGSSWSRTASDDVDSTIWASIPVSEDSGRLWMRNLRVTPGEVYVSGMVYIDAGSGQQSYQAFVIRYDRNLFKKWVKIFGAKDSGMDEEVWSVLPGRNQLYVVGNFTCGQSSPFSSNDTPSSCVGGKDIFVIRMNPEDGSFDPSDALIFGGSGNEEIRDAILVGNTLYFVGTTNSDPFEGLAADTTGEGYLCSVDVDTWTKGSCRLIGTQGAYDEVRVLRMGLVPLGSPPLRAMLLAGHTRGALEPSPFVKTDSDTDAFVRLIIRRDW